ncbi:hypothetical protein GQ42DRAFT_162276 [Ramicandelaber brevisporus]|nr:hypothetical protein GQ42DRAFT_162276 [Ramicandelaber brevisporus]
MPGRDRRSCRQRWVRCINPQLNRNEWAAEERRRLSIIVKHAKNRSNNDDISRVSWADVSRRLGGGRTDIQCKTEYLRVWNERQLKQSRKRQHQQQHQLTSTSGGQKRGKFADDEISRLLQAVKMVFEDGYVGTNTRWKKVSEDTSPWQRVSSLVRTRTAEQCRAKVSYLLQQQQRHGGPTRRRHTDGLTDMEISRLVRAVAKHGRQWTLIARVYFPGKTGSWLSRQYTHYLNQLKKLEGSLDFDE